MKPQNTSFKKLFRAKEGIESLTRFSIETKITTRRRILGDLKDEEESEID
jgi:hypothetical protein